MLEPGRLLATWRHRWQREGGQDLAEYALLLALIALVVVGVVGAVALPVRAMFEDAVQAFMTAP
jgi:Flp pilus assembly pilin Flp